MCKNFSIFSISIIFITNEKSYIHEFEYLNFILTKKNNTLQFYFIFSF